MINSGLAFLTQTDAELKQYEQKNISMMVAGNLIVFFLVSLVTRTLSGIW